MLSALDWVFQNEDSVIVLEDDIIASPDFFVFVTMMLKKYKNDERVFMVTGMNYLYEYPNKFSYFFTTFASCWGWATWKRTWEKIDVSCERYYDYEKLLKKARFSKLYKASFKNTFDYFKNNNINYPTWTKQFGIAQLCNLSTIIAPSINLVSSVGFIGDGEHTGEFNKMPKKIKRYYNAPTHSFGDTILCPTCIVEDELYVKKAKKFLGARKIDRLPNRIESLIKRIFLFKK